MAARNIVGMSAAPPTMRATPVTYHEVRFLTAEAVGGGVGEERVFIGGLDWGVAMVVRLRLDCDPEPDRGMTRNE